MSPTPTPYRSETESSWQTQSSYHACCTALSGSLSPSTKLPRSGVSLKDSFLEYLDSPPNMAWA